LELEQRGWLKETGANWSTGYASYLSELGFEGDAFSAPKEEGMTDSAVPATTPSEAGFYFLLGRAIEESYLDAVGDDDNSSIDWSKLKKPSAAPAQINPVLDDSRFPLGFTTNNANVDIYARRLKMEYVRQARQLQDGINDVIEKCQDFTAEAKTNSKLGKVGR